MKQGQHILLVGSTGSGKTTIAQKILSRRQYNIVLLTKPDTLTWASPWRIVSQASKCQITGENRAWYALRPRLSEQFNEISKCLQNVWVEGGWTLYIDEMYYLQHKLKLTSTVEDLLTQGRSHFLTLMVGVQRPSWVTRFAISEPTHIFASRLHDDRDIKTMGMIAGMQWAESLKSLKRYEFAYLNRDTMESVIVTRDTVDHVGK